MKERKQIVCGGKQRKQIVKERNDMQAGGVWSGHKKYPWVGGGRGIKSTHQYAPGCRAIKSTNSNIPVPIPKPIPIYQYQYTIPIYQYQYTNTNIPIY